MEKTSIVLRLKFDGGDIKIEDSGVLRELIESYREAHKKFDRIIELLQVVAGEIQREKQELEQKKATQNRQREKRLTPEQKGLLQYVDGERTVSEIAEAADKDPGWVSRTLRALEERGYIVGSRLGNKTIYTQTDKPQN